MLHWASASAASASYSRSIWQPNPKAQTIKCPKRTVHGTHYYKSRECKNLSFISGTLHNVWSLPQKVSSKASIALYQSGKMVQLGSQWVFLIRNIIRFRNCLSSWGIGISEREEEEEKKSLDKVGKDLLPLVFAKLLGSRKTKAFRR